MSLRHTFAHLAGGLAIAWTRGSPSSSTTDGTQLQIWDRNGNSNQQWARNSSNELAMCGNKCLDAAG